jgi:hypothetical protein
VVRKQRISLLLAIGMRGGMIMKIHLRTFGFIVLVSICVIICPLNLVAFGKTQNVQKYPVICKDEIGPAPKNVSVEKVDVNADGLVDLMARYPSEGSALYINCGNGQYYRAIRSEGKLKLVAEKKGGWASIDICGSGIIDGIVYRYAYIPMKLERKDGLAVKLNLFIEHDGVSYKAPFPFSKKLGIYAPRYRFDSGVQVVENDTEQDVNSFCYELTSKIQYRIKTGPPYEFWISGVYFTDLNHDGALDAIVNYSQRTGLGSGANAGLFLNGGDNTFVAAANIELGYVGMPFPRFKRQSIKVNGKNFTAIVYKHPNDGKYKDYFRKDQYELFLFQSQLKEFMHIAAIKGCDKQTFIPLDQKKYADIVKLPF